MIAREQGEWPPRTRAANLIFDDPAFLEEPGEFLVQPAYQAELSALRKGAPWFPPAIRDVVVIASSDLGGLDGLTRHRIVRREGQGEGEGKPTPVIVLAGFPGPDELSPLDDDTMGQLLWTLTHELLAHALNACVHEAKGDLILPGVVDHAKMFRPSNPTNGFHAAVKSTLRYVRPERRRAYLSHYPVDIADMCATDYDGADDHPLIGAPIYARNSGRIYDRGMSWAADLTKMVKEPDSAAWKSPLRFHPCQDSDSSGGEDDPAVYGGTNPLRTTAAEMREAEAYRKEMRKRAAAGEDVGLWS